MHDPISGTPPALKAKTTIRGRAASPLRYPGGKARLVDRVAALITGGGLRPQLLVEPFAGGASMSLGLLERDVLDAALIADADPMVAAFWAEVRDEGPRLAEAWMREEISLERWAHWKAAEPLTQQARAMRCLYLNRTSFSGVIAKTGGPLGGRAQAGVTQIDARAYRATVAERIRNAHELALSGRLAVAACADYRSTLELVEGVEGVLLYVDPPYVEKAARLYDHAFDGPDHGQLAAVLADTSAPWILSYDRPALSHYAHLDDVAEHAVRLDYTMGGTPDGSWRSGREVLLSRGL